MAARDFLRNNWPAIIISATAAAIACAGVVMMRGLPPRTIVMATGPEGGAYHEFAKQYQAVLAPAGLQIRLLPTAGSPENIALLHDSHSGVAVAFLQGGTAKSADSKLESLGTVFYEPLWWFHRHEVEGGRFELLRGQKVSIGPEASGTRALLLELLKRNAIDGQVGQLLDLPPRVAREKLLAGEIDAAFMMASWDSPEVQKLLADDRIEISGYSRADAYAALYPFLKKVIVPRGAGDLARDQPPIDVPLIAAKAALVVRQDLHPAIQLLLLGAAVQIHAGPGIFQRAGEFPAAETTDLPLSEGALRFYKSGPPFLHNYLPFWVAELIGKLIILLIPIVAVLYPMIRFLPAAYDWTMRRKIARLYGELRFLEDELDTLGFRDGTSKIITQLERLERKANHLRIPIAYASMLYVLRHHIDLVRKGLESVPTRKSSD